MHNNSKISMEGEKRTKGKERKLSYFDRKMYESWKVYFEKKKRIIAI